MSQAVKTKAEIEAEAEARREHEERSRRVRELNDDMRRAKEKLEQQKADAAAAGETPDPGPDPEAEAKAGHRGVLTIRGELDAARKKLGDLHPKVEADRARCQRANDRREKLLWKWKSENPDEPFDPDLFTPPARPAVPDDGLNRQFHRCHYEVARLEKELERAVSA